MSDFPTSINQFAGFLTSRGLTLEHNSLLKLEPVTHEELKGFLGNVYSGPPFSGGVGIPYFDIDGEFLYANSMPFVRFRRNGFEGKGKYLQSRSTGAHAYLPQVDGIDWVAIAHDTKIPIGVTEGEFKAITACLKFPVPFLALGGTSSLCKKGSHDVVDPFDRFTLNGRTIYVVFDSDDVSNPNVPHKKEVERDLHRTCSILYTNGARPIVLYLARTEKWSAGKKMGLDDYYNAGGTWEELLKTAEEPIHDADLAVLNTQYVVYTAGPYVTRLADGHIFKPAQFRELEQNRRRKTERGTKPVADDFLQQRVRPEYDLEVFDPRIDYGYHSHRRVFNRWRGYAAASQENAEIGQAWIEFLTRMCGEHKSFVESWLAHIIQKPWERTNIALMCVSPVQGIGKSLLGAIMSGIMGRKHCISTSLERMTQQFNNQMEGKVLVVVEEAEGLFKNLEGFVKDFITNPSITVEHKGINAYTVDNYARVMLNSNNPLPLRVTEFERRWFVWMPPITQEDARGEYGEWVNTWSAKFLSDAGLSAVRYALEQVNLEAFDPMGRAPITQELMDMASGSVKSNDLEAEGIYEGMLALGGRMITTAAMTRDYKKAVASLGSLIKARGGNKAQYNWKVDGAVNRGVVWWAKGYELSTRKDANYNVWIEGGLERDERERLLLGSVKLFGAKKFD